MWIANLSNGETLAEGSSPPGEKTPWQKLLDYMQYHNLTMRGLTLRINGTDYHAMPYKEVDGYFQAGELHRSLSTGIESRRHGIGSVVGDQVYIIWVDQQGAVFSDVRELSSCQIHTTLRDHPCQTPKRMEQSQG